MKLAKVNLDDKYSLENGQIYITGTQSLVRLPMLQCSISNSNLGKIPSGFTIYF